MDFNSLIELGKTVFLYQLQGFPRAVGFVQVDILYCVFVFFCRV